jgi:DNA-directed RNA polymerase subunit RPC12/RpoP
MGSIIPKPEPETVYTGPKCEKCRKKIEDIETSHVSSFGYSCSACGPSEKQLPQSKQVRFILHRQNE